MGEFEDTGMVPLDQQYLLFPGWQPRPHEDKTWQLYDPEMLKDGKLPFVVLKGKRFYACIRDVNSNSITDDSEGHESFKEAAEVAISLFKPESER